MIDAFAGSTYALNYTGDYNFYLFVFIKHLEREALSAVQLYLLLTRQMA